jgi:hypothetical protein
MVWMKSGECVIFQGLANAAGCMRKGEMAGNCANFESPKMRDSKKIDFVQLIDIKDMAGPRAITFFGRKAFSGDKKSSLNFSYIKPAYS